MNRTFESDRSALSALILPMAFGVMAAVVSDALLPAELRPPFILTLLLALPLAAGYERFVLFPLAFLLTLNAPWLVAVFIAVVSLVWVLVASLCFSLRGLSWSGSFITGGWLLPIGVVYAVAFIWLVRKKAGA